MKPQTVLGGRIAFYDAGLMEIPSCVDRSGVTRINIWKDPWAALSAWEGNWAEGSVFTDSLQSVSGRKEASR